MSAAPDKLLLGIEGGGTKTIALLASAGGAGRTEVARSEFGPGNLRLLGDRELVAMFETIRERFLQPCALGIGLAGARTEQDLERVRIAARSVWGSVPTAVTHDLRLALEACDQITGTRVLILSGTGSCCFGISGGGREAKVGGAGHLLGDAGSGYAIALSALKAAVREFDYYGRVTVLTRKLLGRLLLNEPEQIIGWAQTAAKSEIAALAPAVFEASALNCLSAREIINEAARALASDAVHCARRLGSRTPALIVSGGVLLHQQSFARRVGQLVREAVPGARLFRQTREAVWGAIVLARNAAEKSAEKTGEPTRASASRAKPPPEAVPVTRGSAELVEFPTAIHQPGWLNSPTEQRNPRSLRLSSLSPEEIVSLMLREERRVVPSLLKVKAEITEAVRLAGETLRRGGRIFYVGAGTSGRLGVLDASECPPTFRAPPEMVQGIIAGGQPALWRAAEGAEDDAKAGARAICFRGVNAKDFVIGIAASGRTPFVWGAISEAKKRRARTALICFNPEMKIQGSKRPNVVIAANVGPEVLTGSTRLKCGTATKLILNMISTGAMIRIGKVIGNLMVDLNPSNVKLRDRAVRILRELAQCDPAAARKALEESGWVIQRAWQNLRDARTRRA